MHRAYAVQILVPSGDDSAQRRADAELRCRSAVINRLQEEGYQHIELRGYWMELPDGVAKYTARGNAWMD